MEDPDKFETLHYGGQLGTTDMTVLGWGTLSEGGLAARVLNYVKLPYVSNHECRRVMSPYSVYSGMMCAGDTKNGKIDACQGDSGGPLVYKKSVGTSLSHTESVIYFYSEIQSWQNIHLQHWQRYGSYLW